MAYVLTWSNRILGTGGSRRHVFTRVLSRQEGTPRIVPVDEGCIIEVNGVATTYKVGEKAVFENDQFRHEVEAVE